MKNMRTKIGEFLIKETLKLSQSNESNPEIYGVSNIEGITKTQHKKSDNLSGYIEIRPSYFAYNPYRINVGSIGLTPEGINGYVSPAYVVFRTDETKLLPEILFNFLKSAEGIGEIRRHARGTVRQALRFEDLCKIEMVVPPIDVQKSIIAKNKKIVSECASLEEKFEKNKKNINRLRKALLEKAIDGAELVELDELCNFTKGNSPIQKTESGEYPLVVTGPERKTSRDYQFDEPAVCVPLVSSTGHGSKTLNYVHYQSGKFALGTILVALTLKAPERLNIKFLHHFLVLNKDTLLVSLMRGMANVTLPIGELKKIQFPLPTLDVQDKFEKQMDYLDSLENLIEKNEKKLTFVGPAHIAESLLEPEMA